MPRTSPCCSSGPSPQAYLTPLVLAGVLLAGGCNDGAPGIVRTEGAPAEARRVGERMLDRGPVNAAANPTVAAQGSEGAAGERRLNPQDALMMIEQSKLTFVAPLRKGKTKEYNGRDFADMLRRKWDWLGADIEDLDRFIEEIASDSFSSFEPYRVELADGTEQDLANWLRHEIKGADRPTKAGQ